jgi:hypothetical protein
MGDDVADEPVDFSRVHLGDSHLRNPDVLAPWPFRSLASFERDGLSFAELVKGAVPAGRAMKEILATVACQNEPEPFTTHETFNRAIHRCHHILLCIESITHAFTVQTTGNVCVDWILVKSCASS